MNGFVILSVSTFIHFTYRIIDQGFCDASQLAGLQRDPNNRFRYAQFIEHFYHVLDVPKIEEVAVQTGRHCLLRCVKNDKCFSTNVAAFYLPSGNISCQLLPTDKYNASAKFKANHTFHHYSIMSPCESFPCQHGGTCRALYETDDYRCTCTKSYMGRNCEKDLDECNTHSYTCDSNADCVNTVGSYYCKCRAGYTGDGKTCNDIDECLSGVHDCHSSASCTNTDGSYSCSCNPPYVGDGKTCIPPECQGYSGLYSADRKVTYSTVNAKCDNTPLLGWFRFDGAAGTRMPTSCPPTSRCDTDAPGWLNGTHPTFADGKVTRQVCFHWDSNCCRWSTNIQVRNCGSFYVYEFIAVPGGCCHCRYCSTD